MAIAWIRSHIGIPGNEKADKEARYQSLLGPISRSPEITTGEGVWRAVRKEERYEKGFGQRTDWYRKALSAYTWLRTDRGPQKQWLHRIGKAADRTCPCGRLTEGGYHITFACPRIKKERSEVPNRGENRMGRTRRSNMGE